MACSECSDKLGYAGCAPDRKTCWWKSNTSGSKPWETYIYIHFTNLCNCHSKYSALSDVFMTSPVPDDLPGLCVIANCILLQQLCWATFFLLFPWEAGDGIVTITKQSLTLSSLLSNVTWTPDYFQRQDKYYEEDCYTTQPNCLRLRNHHLGDKLIPANHS